MGKEAGERRLSLSLALRMNSHDPAISLRRRVAAMVLSWANATSRSRGGRGDGEEGNGERGGERGGGGGGRGGGGGGGGGGGEEGEANGGGGDSAKVKYRARVRRRALVLLAGSLDLAFAAVSSRSKVVEGVAARIGGGSGGR